MPAFGRASIFRYFVCVDMSGRTVQQSMPWVQRRSRLMFNSCCHQQLMAHMPMSIKTYGVVSGLPSLSSIFACLVGGPVIDAIGADKACVLFTFIVLLGNSMATVSVSLR
jgi:hypothetical protein